MTSQMPQSLCPYFWKLVVMWIFILPYSILALPAIVMNYISERRDEEEVFDTLGTRLFVGLIFWVMLVTAINMLITIFYLINPIKSLEGPAAIGLCCWCISILVGGWFLGKHLWEERIYSTTYREKRQNIIVEFVKAKYHKYCPKIDWK